MDRSTPTPIKGLKQGYYTPLNCRADLPQPLSRGLANTGAEETRQEDKQEERE
jgi:hypothetical protein